MIVIFSESYQMVGLPISIFQDLFTYDHIRITLGIPKYDILY
jgi:hypothetical protein